MVNEKVPHGENGVNSMVAWSINRGIKFLKNYKNLT